MSKTVSLLSVFLFVMMLVVSCGGSKNDAESKNPALEAKPAAGNQTCQWWKIAFDAPVAFAAPRKVGLDAVVLIHPADAELGSGLLEITLAALPQTMIKEMGLKDDEILGYIETTFLGAGPAETPAERTFFGKTVKGDRQTLGIPRTRHLEAYVVPLPDGDSLGIMFVNDPRLAPEEVEKIVAQIAQTLRLSSAN
jgi:hypothetical protein